MKKPKDFLSFYKKVTGNEGEKCNYPTRLDLYGCGCSHDCSYCYAKSLLSFRNLWNPTNPSVAPADKVARTIARHAHNDGGIVRLGGMTDCFQPVEAHRKATYNAIKELNAHNIPYLIVTKSDLVATDEYIEILDKRLAHIQISITTTDDELSTTYEKAVVPSRRIAAVEKLQKLGFDVTLRLSPFIPQYIDYEVINSVKCDKILVEFLRVNTWIRNWFKIDYSEYTLKQSGYLHLPLESKLNYLKNITGFKEMSVCDDVTEHYEYFKEHFNHNPKDCCNLRKSIVEQE